MHSPFSGNFRRERATVAHHEHINPTRKGHHTESSKRSFQLHKLIFSSKRFQHPNSKQKGSKQASMTNNSIDGKGAVGVGVASSAVSAEDQSAMSSGTALHPFSRTRWKKPKRSMTPYSE